MAKNSTGRVFPTKYSESVEIGTFEAFNKPSMTEPDNAMSIPEIIARFTRGYGLEVQQHPWTSGSAFDEDGDPNNLEDFLDGPKPVQDSSREAPQEPSSEAPQEPASSEGQ